MKETKIVMFDKLDEKTIKELPFLLEVIASLGNKIARIFDPIYDDIEDTIENNLVKKKLWRIKWNRKNVFYPFTEEEYSNQTKIQNLEIAFAIENFLTVAKIIREKWKNYFIAEFGAYLSEEKVFFYYFQIHKGEDYLKYGGNIKDALFYKSIQQKVKNFKVEIAHPDINGEPESITFKCFEHDPKKINEMYTLFKNDVLLPILKSIK